MAQNKKEVQRESIGGTELDEMGIKIHKKYRAAFGISK